jgi:hypothetical protein
MGLYQTPYHAFDAGITAPSPVLQSIQRQSNAKKARM